MNRTVSRIGVVMLIGLALSACMPTPQQKSELARINAARDAQAATANTDR